MPSVRRFHPVRALACGRIDPDVPIEQEKVTLSGGAELDERTARDLRFAM